MREYDKLPRFFAISDFKEAMKEEDTEKQIEILKSFTGMTKEKSLKETRKAWRRNLRKSLSRTEITKENIIKELYLYDDWIIKQFRQWDMDPDNKFVFLKEEEGIMTIRSLNAIAEILRRRFFRHPFKEDQLDKAINYFKKNLLYKESKENYWQMFEAFII